MNHLIALHVVLALATGAAPALAAQQSCASFSAEFTGGGFDQSPIDFEVLDLGAGPTLCAAGEFTVAGTVQALRVAQWNGSAWAGIGHGFSNDVHDLASIDLGTGPQVYAAGRFASSGGQTRNRIARWNGSSWDALGSGLGGPVFAICQFSTPAGNRLVAGGQFTTAGGQPAMRVAQWDGSSWSALGAQFGGLFAAGVVNALVVHDDGSGPALYAGGTFSGGIARWDGSQWSIVGAGLNGTLLSLASYDAGPGQRFLLAGGNFGSAPASAFFGWDGSQWSDLGLSGFNGAVDKIAVRQELSGPVAYLAGSFEPAFPNPSPFRHMAKWTPAGLVTLPPVEERARCLAFFDDGTGEGEQLYVGGTFQRVLTSPEPLLQRVARLENGAWSPLMPVGHALYAHWTASYLHGTAMHAWTHAVTGERDLYVGGTFGGSSDDPSVVSLARWNGSSFSNVAAPLPGPVSAFGEWVPPGASASSLVVGSGSGTHAFDGTTWTLLGSPSALRPNGYIQFTPPGATQELLVAYGYSLFPPTPSMSTCAAFDGTSWSSIGGGGITGPIHAAVRWDAPGPLPDGIYFAGQLTYGSAAGPAIAFWDGSSWQFPTGGFATASDLKVFDDGTGEALYANTDQGLMRFDGTNWSFVGTGGTVLESFDDGSGPALYLTDRHRLRNGSIEIYAPTPAAAGYPAVAHHWVDEHGISQGLFFTGAFEALGGVPAVGLARYWDPCGYAKTYCSAKVNSLGCTPQIGWSGIPSATGTSPFMISASNVLNQKSGLLFYGATGRIAKAFQGGTLCVRSPVRRTPVQTSQGSVGAPDCSGTFALDFTPYLQGALGPGFNFGDTVDAQWWYRDPLANFSTGLTDALEFQVRP